MGEIADMILGGMLCQVCGVYMGRGDGFPVTCAACSDDEVDAIILERPKKAKSKCPICGKMKINVEAHSESVHQDMAYCSHCDGYKESAWRGEALICVTCENVIAM